MYVHYVILIDKVWAVLTLDDWGPKATTVNGFFFFFFFFFFFLNEIFVLLVLCDTNLLIKWFSPTIEDVV